MAGSAVELWRFPVKSMQGEQLQEMTVTEQGVLGDRAYGLVDVETGKVASAKSVKLFPDLMACRTAFIEPPRAGHDTPPVRINLPNGQSVRSDSDGIDRTLSAYFQREVRLVRAAPGVYTAKQYQSNAADGKKVEATAPAGAFRDAYPLSVLTTSTLERFNELCPQSRFDSRRFRMNVIVATKTPGFIENAWIGHALGFENGIQLDVVHRDPRCVMTTLPQDDLPRDPDILRTIVRHNKIPVDDSGERPCAGVYAVVTAPGTVQTGSRVTLV